MYLVCYRVNTGGHYAGGVSDCLEVIDDLSQILSKRYAPIAWVWRLDTYTPLPPEEIRAAVANAEDDTAAARRSNRIAQLREELAALSSF